MGAPQYEQAGADVAGSGTTNTIPRWTGPTTLGDSLITQNAAANAVGVGATVNNTWAAGWRAVQVGQNAAIWAETAAIDGRFSQNTVWTGSAFNYLVNGAALMYAQNANGHAWSYAAAGIAGNPITFTTGMILNTSGNVGIGTASPTANLHVYKASGVGATVESGSGTVSIPLSLVSPNNTLSMNNRGDISFSLLDSSVYQLGIRTLAAQPIFFATNGTERARIDSAGRMCIGTTTATTGRALTTVADLDVFGLTVGRGANGVAGNTAFGAAALGSVTSGSATVGVGFEALNALSTGAGNTAVGYRAVRAVTTSNSNTGIGYLAVANMTGASNTGLGQQALQGAVGASGGSNVGVGLQAGLALTTGANNVLVGSTAGDSVTTGSSNIVIGSGADLAAATDSNKLVIGDATNYVATNGGATTYYATAGALAGYIIVRLNGTDVKLPVYAL